MNDLSSGKRLARAAKESSSQKDVGAVVNALQILQHLVTAASPVGVAAVARATGISTSTCFNILRTLTRAGFASFDSVNKTYTVGLAMAEMVARLVGSSHAELIRPELERLALNYQTLILLWRVVDETHLVLLDRAHSHAALRIEVRVGYRHPMFAGAIGRCVAATLKLPTAELRRRFAAVRWQTPLTFETYQQQVAETAPRGWGLDDGQLFRGITSVGALVTDSARTPRLGFSAVSITGQQSSEQLEALGRDLVGVAALVGRSLFPPSAPS